MAGARTRTYRLRFLPTEPTPNIRVSIQLPATWKDQVDPRGEPTFTAPGARGLVFGMVATNSSARGPAASVEQVFSWQYNDGAGVTRVPLSGGRLWACRVEPPVTHARLFMPVDGGVVMAFAMLRSPSEALLTEVRAVFETVSVAKG